MDRLEQVLSRLDEKRSMLIHELWNVAHTPVDNFREFLRNSFRFCLLLIYYRMLGVAEALSKVASRLERIQT